MASKKQPTTDILNAHFDLVEWAFMIDAINGVLCTPNTLLANILANAEFAQIPDTLGEKLKALREEDIELLYDKLYEFWQVEWNNFFSTSDRIKEIGITVKPWV